MLKKLIALASLAAAFSSAGWIKPARVPQTSRDQTLVVGVFRPDGVIVPFAVYAKRKWTNPWHRPLPDAQPDEPNTIADLPTPWYESFVKPGVEWYVSLSAADTNAVNTSRSVQVCSHCQQVWGLLSDYPNAKLAERNECVRSLGIALSKKRAAQAMERLTDASPDWKQLLTFLGPEFELAENAGPTEASQHYYSQIPRTEERAKVPLSMLNLYRNQVPEEGQILFYFEVSKEYPKPPDSNDVGCNNISLLGGWALRDAHAKLALLDSQFNPTDCDWKEGGRVLPFMILQVDGKTFAIVEEDSYEGESYTILEIQRDGVRHVLDTYAGSC